MMVNMEPDRTALEIAHKQLCVTLPLDDILKRPTLKIILENVARQHTQRRALLTVKKPQTNND